MTTFPAYTTHGGELGRMTLANAEDRWGEDNVCFRPAGRNAPAHIEVWAECGCCVPFTAEGGAA
jgi:hypothetical protein